MKIRPQSEQSHVHPGPGLGAPQGAAQARFDAALLQASQTMRDAAEPEPGTALSPQVQQALTNALDQLNQKSLAQLQSLAHQSQNLASFAGGLAQAAGLSAGETAQLNRLLQMALPRLAAAKAGPGAAQALAGSDPRAALRSGGQAVVGAALERAVGFSALLGAQPSAPEGGGSRAPQGRETNQTPALFASVQGSPPALAPFQGVGQAPGAASGRPSLPVGAVSAPDALVFSVALNQPLAGPSDGGPAGFGSGQGTAGLRDASAQPGSIQAQGEGRSPGAQAQGPQGPSAAPGTASQGRQGAAVQAADHNGSTETAFPVELGFTAQWSDAAAPVPIQADSQVTLKGDGTWVLPQSAGSAAPKANGTSGPPQPQVGPGPGPTTAQQQVSAADQSTFLGSLVQPMGAPAAQESSPVQGLSAAAPDPAALEQIALQAETPQGFDPLAVLGDAGPGPGQQQAPSALAAGDSQAQASQLTVAQFPVANQVLVGGTTRAPGTGRGLDLAPAGGMGSGPRGAAADAQALAGQAQGAPTRGSSGGFGAMDQSLAQALGAASGAGSVLPQGLAQSVANAINLAAGATPGRLTISLSPASLGSVQVDLSLVDGKLTAHLVTSQQDVRDVLVRDLAGFKAGLESHGVVVNEVSVAVRAGTGDAGRGNGQNAMGRGFTNDFQGKPAGAQAALDEAALTASAGASAYASPAGGPSQGFSALA